MTIRVKYSREGKAFASFSSGGLTKTEVHRLLQAAATEVYLQMGPTGQLYRQQVGAPMGGKAASEMANIYCYAIESQFIDALVAANRLPEAQLWSNTWRYIDDLLGFGDRRWDQVEYRMEHRDTTTVPGTEVGFLGMVIKRTARDIDMAVLEKGAGWQWKPQRYLEYSSIHTPWTKRFLMKGLLIRAQLQEGGAVLRRRAAAPWLSQEFSATELGLVCLQPPSETQKCQTAPDTVVP